MAAKCQENGWLRAGGYAWQDDPYLEDYPYDIREASSMEELRSFFRRGNWAIRQGVVYRDLAFVQQVDGGDEWWTLKKIGDEGEPGDWLAFENCSFGGLSRDRHGFNDLIVGMSAASASECERLEYRLPMLDEPWSLMTACSENRAGDQVECKILESRCGDYAVKAYERPSFDGAMLEISDRASRALVFHDGVCDSIVSASGRARDALSSLIEGSRESDGRSRSDAPRSRLRSLRDASSEARESSSAINPPFNRNGKKRQSTFLARRPMPLERALSFCEVGQIVPARNGGRTDGH